MFSTRIYSIFLDELFQIMIIWQYLFFIILKFNRDFRLRFHRSISYFSSMSRRKTHWFSLSLLFLPCLRKITIHLYIHIVIPFLSNCWLFSLSFSFSNARAYANIVDNLSRWRIFDSWWLYNNIENDRMNKSRSSGCCSFLF